MALSRRQPVRTPTGQPYGQAGDLSAQQEAAPLLDLREGPPMGAAGPLPAAGDPLAPAAGPPIDIGAIGGDVWAPGDQGPHPEEPILPNDPITQLRAINARYPTAGLTRLIERLSARLRDEARHPSPIPEGMPPEMAPQEGVPAVSPEFGGLTPDEAGGLPPLTEPPAGPLEEAAEGIL